MSRRTSNSSPGMIKRIRRALIIPACEGGVLPSDPIAYAHSRGEFEGEACFDADEAAVVTPLGRRLPMSWPTDRLLKIARLDKAAAAVLFAAERYADALNERKAKRS